MGGSAERHASSSHALATFPCGPRPIPWLRASPGAAGRHGDRGCRAAGGHHLALCWRAVEAVHSGGWRAGDVAAPRSGSMHVSKLPIACCPWPILDAAPPGRPPPPMPAPQGDTPPALVNRWGQDTLEHYLRLYQSPDAPAAGGVGCSRQGVGHAAWRCGAWHCAVRGRRCCGCVPTICRHEQAGGRSCGSSSACCRQ